MAKTQRWKVGDATITKVVEIELPGAITWIVPDATPERLSQLPWLQPHFCDAQGVASMSVHAFVIEADGMCMVVDTCVGNDKERDIRGWNMRQGPFLSDLEGAGFAPESIDRVMCTHLHVDHVGWNTRRVDGPWKPTFPNARYLFEQRELAHWQAAESRSQRTVMEDSVLPVLDAGLADAVASDHRVSESVRLVPTPGHTPGHVSVRISSGGHDAVVTGDLMHHPAQVAHAEWGSAADTDPELAKATRSDFVERYADTPTLVLGTHFATPTAGRILRDGASYRFVVD
ncbi:MAG: MBL fold metallo-hydrolase [Myxococcales bacterium]|nr:MBL fold metallo-hydrolase [Myxococcales bacterium]